MPKSSILFSICCLVIFGCSKQQQKPSFTGDNIKISIVSGNNQTSEIGYALTDSVLVKVTNNGAPIDKCPVQFTGSGCNSDLTVQLLTKSDGTVKYLWRLAANQGSQTLNVVAINHGLKADSIVVNATASSSTGPNYISACTPYDMSPVNICQLTSGRLLACFKGTAAIRYSDDNGVSWNPLKSFGSSHFVISMVTTSQNEIFAATKSDGLFYSKDAGSTWADISPPTNDKTQPPTNIDYSNNTGSLIFTGNLNQIFISTDKGTTWVASLSGLTPNVGYLFPCRLNNGDLYIVSYGRILFKSVDGGVNWVAQNTIATEPIAAIYVDNNGWFYKANLFNGIGSTIFISKDNGQTFTTYATNIGIVEAMTILQDGNIYFSDFSSIYAIFNPGISTKVSNTDVSFYRFCIINQNRFLYISRGLINY